MLKVYLGAFRFLKSSDRSRLRILRLRHYDVIMWVRKHSGIFDFNFQEKEAVRVF